MPKRVLVVDDEADIREVAQVSLELMAGLEVMVASSSREGLQKAILEQPDAILLDVMLPEINGPALLQELQMHPATRHIPVVFLTARSHPQDRQNFAELGIIATIAKPFKPAQLAAQLLEALGWSSRSS